MWMMSCGIARMDSFPLELVLADVGRACWLEQAELLVLFGWLVQFHQTIGRLPNLYIMMKPEREKEINTKL